MGELAFFQGVCTAITAANVQIDNLELRIDHLFEYEIALKALKRFRSLVQHLLPKYAFPP